MGVLRISNTYLYLLFLPNKALSHFPGALQRNRESTLSCFTTLVKQQVRYAVVLHKKPTNQPTNQPTKQSQPASQPASQAGRQASKQANQPTNQASKQANKQTNHHAPWRESHPIRSPSRLQPRRGSPEWDSSAEWVSQTSTESKRSKHPSRWVCIKVINRETSQFDSFEEGKRIDQSTHWLGVSLYQVHTQMSS